MAKMTVVKEVIMNSSWSFAATCSPRSLYFSSDLSSPLYSLPSNAPSMKYLVCIYHVMTAVPATGSKCSSDAQNAQKRFWIRVTCPFCTHEGDQWSRPVSISSDLGEGCVWGCPGCPGGIQRSQAPGAESVLESGICRQSGIRRRYLSMRIRIATPFVDGCGAEVSEQYVTVEYQHKHEDKVESEV